MKIIGVTGKSGSGKTTFAKLLANKLNCEYVDIDKISHIPLQKPEIISILCKKFGNEILNKEGKIDTKKMGNIVFSDEEKLNKLMQITEADAYKELEDILSMQKKDIIVFEWIKLPTCKYWQQCNIKILVKAEPEKRKQRVIKRDNISEEYFEKRDSASIEYEENEFDYIFENSYNEQEMKETIDIISRKIMED